MALHVQETLSKRIVIAHLQAFNLFHIIMVIYGTHIQILKLGSVRCKNIN